MPLSRKAAFIICLISLLWVQGCGTIGFLIAERPEEFTSTPIYGGLQMDIYAITGEGGAHAVFAIFDFPLSFALDTALLPITVFAHFFSQGGEGDSPDGLTDRNTSTPEE